MHRNPHRASKSNYRIIKIALVISWLIIFGGVYRLFYANPSRSAPDATPTPPPSPDSTTGDEQTRYFIGEKVLMEGLISPVGGLDVYTHDFQADNGSSFGLKSATVDLFSYTGVVQVKGQVTDFKGDRPIIQVVELVGQRADQIDDGTGSEQSNEQYYLFEDVGLGFDLSISDGYTIEERGEDIILIDEQSTEDPQMLSITPFACLPTDNLKDCAGMQAKFIDYGNETFTTSTEITLYNLTETNTRVAFNGDEYGYYISPRSQADLVAFVGMMHFISDDLIQAAVQQDLDQLCKDINYQMARIDEFAVEYGEEGRAIATAEGVTTEGNLAATCRVSVRLGTTLKPTLLSFAVDTDEQAPTAPEADRPEDSSESAPVADTDTPDAPQPTDPGSDDVALSAEMEDQSGQPESLSGWLQFSSVRGYSVYFSSQAISYDGALFEAPISFDVDNLECPYAIRVIERARADQVSVDPDLVVYECSGDPGQYQLKTKNLAYIGTV